MTGYDYFNTYIDYYSIHGITFVDFLQEHMKDNSLYEKIQFCLGSIDYILSVVEGQQLIYYKDAEIDIQNLFAYITSEIKGYSNYPMESPYGSFWDIYRYLFADNNRSLSIYELNDHLKDFMSKFPKDVQISQDSIYEVGKLYQYLLINNNITEFVQEILDYVDFLFTYHILGYFHLIPVEIKVYI